MGAAILGNNTTIKIAAAIAATTTYTVPANSYAICNIFHEGLGSITVGGLVVFLAQDAGSAFLPGTVATDVVMPIMQVYAGPGQTITGPANTRITGVLFSNSP